MKKSISKNNKKAEKERRKSRFLRMDDDYEDDEIDDEEDDEDEEEDEIDDGDDGIGGGMGKDGDDDGDEEDKKIDDEEMDDEEIDDEEMDDEEIDDEDDDDEEDDEENDDEEDDDDEEEIDDEDEDDEPDSETVKRMHRRKRRIRNQILAYGLIVVLAAGLVGGGIFLGRGVIQKYQSKKQAEEFASQLQQLEEMEKEPTVEIEAPTAEEETTEVSPLDEIANARIAEMPLEDKVTALFIVTPEQLTGVDVVTKAGETTKNALTEYKVGGLVYTDSNIKDSDQLKELLSNTGLIDQTLFLAVSEEGGEHSVVASKTDAAAALSMAEIGAEGSADSAYQAGSTIGTYLSEYGFNLNFAPVADVKISEDSVLGDRSFGSDPAKVGELAASFIEGMTEKGVSSCIKTFPGLGSVTESTAEGMADTQRSLSDMESCEFLAYQEAIAAGSEFVMVGTVSAPNLTGDNTPCCFSGAAVNLLRENLGFDGIIVTGALNETAITDYYTSAEVGEKALKAGVDMIYMPENFKEAYDGLLKAVQDGTIEESRIDESLLRIYRVKYKDKIS